MFPAAVIWDCRVAFAPGVSTLAPRISGPLSNTLTAPLAVSETAPVKTLLGFAAWMSLPESEVVPETLNVPSHCRVCPGPEVRERLLSTTNDEPPQERIMPPAVVAETLAVK